jgi:hypothetical protein
MSSSAKHPRGPEDDGGGPQDCAHFAGEALFVMTADVGPGNIAAVRKTAKLLYAGAMAAWPTHKPGGFQLAMYLVRALTTSRSESQAGRAVWTDEMIGAFESGVNGNPNMSHTTEYLSQTVLAVEAALLVMDTYYDALCLTAQRILQLEPQHGPVFWLLFCAVAGWLRTENNLSFTTNALDVFNDIEKTRVITRGDAYYGIAGTGWVQRSMETPDAARQERFRVVKMAIMCICGKSATTVRLPPEMVDCIFRMAYGNTARQVVAQP